MTAVALQTPTNGTQAAQTLAAIDAERLHETALAAFRLGNRGRLKLCEILRALQESRQYLELGYPSIAAYAQRFYRYGKSETYEAVRVARALDDLPKCRAAFADGKIDWSALKEITRVASPGTEEEWLAFAAKHNNVELRAEVQDAVEKRRDRPRDDRYGLPNLRVNLVLKLSRSDHETVRKGLGTLVPEISERLGGREVDLGEVLVFLAKRLLAGGLEAVLEAGSGRSERNSPAHTVLYHYCPDCKRARVATDEGMVEVECKEVERIEGEASLVGIDAPTPPALRRKVLLRDGARCSNPCCHNRADQVHHVVHRSRGGRTTLWNEISLCATCHALAHSGLLQVEGDPESGLRWSGHADSMRIDLQEERAQADQLPAIVVQSGPTQSGYPDSDRNGRRESGYPDSERKDWSYLASGLVRLGFPKGDAREWIAQAVERLASKGAPLTEERILKESLAAG